MKNVIKLIFLGVGGVGNLKFLVIYADGVRSVFQQRKQAIRDVDLPRTPAFDLTLLKAHTTTTSAIPSYISFYSPFLLGCEHPLLVTISCEQMRC
jgi:hypothetical protein